MTEHWRYFARVTAFTQGRTVRWPATETMTVGTSGLAPDCPAQRVLPWAQSWEMWNEADICFYMGDWNRYMDPLRMSWGAGRQRLPHTPMVYGGSTGNFTAMGMIASGSPRYCFDYIALHTGGDVE